MTRRTAALITPNAVHWDDGLVRGVTDEMGEHGRYDIGQVLEMMARRTTGRECTVLIRNCQVHELRGAPRIERDWKYTKIGPWTTYRRDGRRVHVGLVDQLDPGRFLLGDAANDHPAVLTLNLATYQRIVGAAWSATAGTAGIGLLREHYLSNKEGQQPLWHRKQPGFLGGVGDIRWKRQPTPMERRTLPYVHQYDITAAYLSAAAQAILAWGKLERTGPIPFDASTAGYWEIAVPDNQAIRVREGGPAVVPAQLIRKGSTWVTSPVLAFLMEMGRKPDVLDSWTCPDWTTETGEHVQGSRRWLRWWGEKLRDARKKAHGTDLALAVKRTPNEAIGLMGREGGRCYMLDVRDTVIDLLRCNLLRKIYTIGSATGRWPLRVNVDAVYYPSDTTVPSALGGVVDLDTDTPTMGHLRYIGLSGISEYVGGVAA